MNRFFAVLLAATVSANAQEMSMTQSDEFSEEQLNFFESKIRPVLVKNCYKCHAKEGDKIKGGLLLDTRDGSIRGGDSGSALTPGNAEESLIYIAMTYEDSSLEMPPKTKLPNHVLADFKKWIDMGAPDPRRSADADKPAEKYSSTIDIEKGRKEHWAYQVPTKHEVPQTKKADWAKNEIDQFVLASLEKNELAPNSDTDARTFLRRVYYDLIGLPPSIAATEAFVKAWDLDPDKATANAVDELLASERFGERWGRHWLDVARYAESSGRESNATFPHAWRYRDYVIDAFNDDKPFDQFVVEQIAGDLLQFETDEQQAEQLVATGFLTIGTKGLNERNPRQFRFDMIDEQIDTATKAVLATTVACARCHDHKFDPIPMSDYYAMAGIFLSSHTHFGSPRTAQNRNSTSLIELPGNVPSAGEKLPLGELVDLQARNDMIAKQLRETEEKVREARASGNTDAAQRLRLQSLNNINQSGIVKSNLEAFDNDGNRKPLAMAMQDGDTLYDSPILVRGEIENATKETVPRGFVQVIQTNDERPIPETQSGRLQMARWMTSPENPMTSRVFVNRTWHWLFGQGLVTSVDNFGTTGEKPTHPELLDQLAVRFIEMEWSVKSLIKEIVTSRTYRMNSNYDEAKFLTDPDNKQLWRTNKRRIDAESFRDAALAVSGQIDLERPQGSIVAAQGNGFVGRAGAISSVEDYLTNSNFSNRSVYVPVIRDMLPDSLQLFDFADPSLVLGARETTTVPSQALFLMNSNFLQTNAEAMSNLLTNELNLRGGKLGYTAFYLCYSRPPTEEEGRKTKAYFERFISTAKESGLNEAEATKLALHTFCQSLMSSAEFRYVN